MAKVIFTISITPIRKGQLCEVIRSGNKPSRATFFAITKQEALKKCFEFLNRIYEEKEPKK